MSANDTQGWLRSLAERLSSGQIDDGEEELASDRVFDSVNSNDWQVRRLTASALGEFRYINVARIDIALSQLQGDSNSYVREAAKRSRLKQKRARHGSTPALRTPIESQGDQLHREVLAKIEKVDIGKITHQQIYDIALAFGDRAYAELAADTAHEVRSLLTPVEGGLVLMRRRMRDGQPPTEQQIGDLLSHLELMNNLVENLRVYGASQVGPFEGHSIYDLIEEAIVISEARSNSHVKTKIECPADLQSMPVSMVRKRLLRAFVNICTNGLQAMSDSGELGVTIALEAERQSVRVEVRDTGRGMSEKQMLQALRRFRSSRKNEGGTGLGLPIAQKIIEQDHLGRLRITSVKGMGTTVHITLPINCRSFGHVPH